MGAFNALKYGFYSTANWETFSKPYYGIYIKTEEQGIWAVYAVGY